MIVSVIIPYNKDRGYLKYAMDSVKKQSSEDYELILSKSKGGCSYNFNEGLKRSKGDLIRFLAEDDLLTVNSIKDTIKYFKENPNIDFIISKTYVLTISGLVKVHPSKHSVPTLQQCLKKYSIHGGTVVYRKRCFEKRQFDETLWTAEEYDFNLWLLKNGYKLGFLNSFTYKYRKHLQQKSIGKRDKNYQKLRTIEKNKIKQRYV